MTAESRSFTTSPSKNESRPRQARIRLCRATSGGGRLMRTHLPTRARATYSMLIVTALVAALLSAVQFAVPPRAHAASPGTISLHVQSARSVNNGPGFVHKGDPITTYKWMINQDDTGNPGTISNQGTQNCLPPRAPGGSSDPQYADTCQWPGTRTTSGLAPIEAQGDQSDLNENTTVQLPAGKYLISVTAADFKIDGAHFTVDGNNQRVVVEMNPTPL